MLAEMQRYVVAAEVWVQRCRGAEVRLRRRRRRRRRHLEQHGWQLRGGGGLRAGSVREWPAQRAHQLQSPHELRIRPKPIMHPVGRLTTPPDAVLARVDSVPERQGEWHDHIRVVVRVPAQLGLLPGVGQLQPR